MFTPTEQNESEDDFNERKKRYELGMPWGTKKIVKEKLHHMLILNCAKSRIRGYAFKNIITPFSAN